MSAALQFPLRVDFPYTLAVWAHFGPSIPVADLLRKAYTSFLDRREDDVFCASLREWAFRNDMEFTMMPTGKLQAPPLEVLRSAGLGHEEERRLADATHEILIMARDGARPPHLALWSALTAARAFADIYGGVVLDRDVPRLLPVDTYAEIPRGRLRLSDHVCVVSYDVSVLRVWGMRKFQLPALEVGEVSAELRPQACSMLLAMAQILVFRARKTLQKTASAVLSVPAETRLDLGHEALRQESIEFECARGARRQTEVALHLRRASAPGEEDVLQINSPPSFRGGGWLRSALTDLFGNLPKAKAAAPPAPPKPTDTRTGHERARAEFAELKQRWQRGFPHGHRLCVKRAFPTPKSGPEYLWIQVSTWFDGMLRGPLVSDPRERTDLSYGQTLQLQEDDVYDWMILCPDGTTLGGYTETRYSSTYPRLY